MIIIEEGRTIKLAEALIIQAERREYLNNLRLRLMANAKIPHGDIPTEDPATLLADVHTTLKVLEDLSKRIQLTQSQTLLESGKTVADALIEREVFAQKRFIYQSLVDSASPSLENPQENEVRWLRTVNVSQLQHQIEQMTKEHQLLDIQIQKATWSTELLD